MEFEHRVSARRLRPIATAFVAAVAALGLSVAAASAQSAPPYKPIPHPGIAGPANPQSARTSAEVDLASSEADRVNGTVVYPNGTVSGRVQRRHSVRKLAARATLRPGSLASANAAR